VLDGVKLKDLRALMILMKLLSSQIWLSTLAKRMCIALCTILFCCWRVRD
jgi:hypothetical protein